MKDQTVIPAKPGTAAVVVSVDPSQDVEQSVSVSHHLVVAWQVKTIQMGGKDESGAAVPVLCPEPFAWGGDDYLFIVNPDGSLCASHSMLQEHRYLNIDHAASAALAQSMKDRKTDAIVRKIPKNHKEVA